MILVRLSLRLYNTVKRTCLSDSQASNKLSTDSESVWEERTGHQVQACVVFE